MNGLLFILKKAKAKEIPIIINTGTKAKNILSTNK
jgi:hypothetical protein